MFYLVFQKIILKFQYKNFNIFFNFWNSFTLFRFTKLIFYYKYYQTIMSHDNIKFFIFFIKYIIFIFILENEYFLNFLYFYLWNKLFSIKIYIDNIKIIFHSFFNNRKIFKKIMKIISQYIVIILIWDNLYIFLSIV